MPIQKILLVDDSKTELHYLSDLLTRKGYSVRTAENGDDAMRRLDEDRPDLILMDIVMPGKNGFQLTRTITRDERFADVPVIICTAPGQQAAVLKEQLEPMNVELLLKPFDIDELFATVKQMIEQAEAKAEASSAP